MHNSRQEAADEPSMFTTNTIASKRIAANFMLGFCREITSKLEAEYGFDGKGNEVLTLDVPHGINTNSNLTVRGCAQVTEQVIRLFTIYRGPDCSFPLRR